MEISKYRILLIEAYDIIKSFNEDKYDVVLPLDNKEKYYEYFKNVFDASLDLEQLEKAYKKIYRNNKFSFKDEYDNNYMLSIVNVKFYKSGEYTRKEIRSKLYEFGFYINDIHYVRYKRSSGSSRSGKCLFIDEKLLKTMEKWGECGLKNKNFDLASWESYKALSLSSIKEKIKIPLEGILFINDVKVSFKEDVVCVDEENGELIVNSKEEEISNDIWDGQSLLDESLFVDNFQDKHMLLLRNKFYKTCAFKTKIQKWFLDNNIKDIEQLKRLGHITLAKDISQIVMITTPNSLKYLKFTDGFKEKNILKWIENIDNEFGVVKYDKRTRYFNGRMVQSSYQFLNTIQLSKEECEELVDETYKYILTIRNDIDFMRYHFENAYHAEKEEVEENEEADGLAKRAEVIFKLLNINNKFAETKLYYYFKNKVVEGLKNKGLEGHILLSGTNATLFGNGPEMLLQAIGKFDKTKSVLKPGTIRCESFNNNVELVCARSPHITMGNLYVVKNVIDDDLWNYFDLGKNIVCVNAINENIQHRLNGCDYDSDMMLITDNKMLVNKAKLNQNIFKVPVCKIESVKNIDNSLVEMDYKTSENKIGEIVNLSQKLNSIIWDRLNSNDSFESIKEVYEDVCKLAVLSGIEIDKAKRSFNINTSKELRKITEKYKKYERPNFLISLDKKTAEKHNRKNEKINLDESKYKTYNTAMSYIYNLVKEIDFRAKKAKKTEYIPISSMLTVKGKPNSTAYAQKTKILKMCDDYILQRTALQAKLKDADSDEKKVIYQDIRNMDEKCFKEMSIKVVDEKLIELVIKDLEKNSIRDWHLYAPFFKNEKFINILKDSKEPLKKIIEKQDGLYHIYKFVFDKI